MMQRKSESVNELCRTVQLGLSTRLYRAQSPFHCQSDQLQDTVSYGSIRLAHISMYRTNANAFSRIYVELEVM
jgi:hypothetical protein